MDKKPKTPKAPSLRKVAKVYKKTTKAASSSNSGGATYFTDQARPTALTKTTRTPNFKPKAKSITLGATRGNKPTTVRKKGRA